MQLRYEFAPTFLKTGSLALSTRVFLSAFSIGIVWHPFAKILKIEIVLLGINDETHRY